jgi:hypothetical protein
MEPSKLNGGSFVIFCAGNVLRIAPGVRDGCARRIGRVMRTKTGSPKVHVQIFL